MVAGHMDFEWDFSKELENIRKHRVTFAAVASFRDPRGIQLVDMQHSSGNRLSAFVHELPQLLGAHAAPIDPAPV